MFTHTQLWDSFEREHDRVQFLGGQHPLDELKRLRPERSMVI